MWGAWGMTHPLARVFGDPWGMLDELLDGPLHPGGVAATEALLDRASVTAGTRLLDVGCGYGEAIAMARDRGAVAVGLDRDPGRARQIRGDISVLPVATDAVDVILAECVLCLAGDREMALAEFNRVLPDTGRLALAAVVVDAPLPDVPDALTAPMCLSDPVSTGELVRAVEAQGFTVETFTDHHKEVLAMRDELASRIDYEGLLRAVVGPDNELVASLEALEAAADAGTITYVSLTAS